MATDLIYKVPVRVIWLQTAIYIYISIDVQGGHLTREQTIVDRGQITSKRENILTSNIR